MAELKKIPKKEKPLYLGHRARLRSRFSADNGESMPDYEMLELLLMISIPRRDVKPLAKRLIAKFGNLHGVIYASADELANFKGVSKSTLGLFKLVRRCRKLLSGKNLSSGKEKEFLLWSDFLNYSSQQVKKIGADELLIFCFDDAKKLLGEKVYQRDQTDGYIINFQQLNQESVNLNATQIVVCHKGLSGQIQPTENDAKLTEKICDELYLYDITVVDHLIFSDENEKMFSFADKGRMPSAKIKRMLKTQKILKEIKKL